MAIKKRKSGGGSRKSTTKQVLYTLGAVAGGGLAGAALGRGSLLVGAGAIVLGAMQNNQLLTVAGAAACVAPGLTSSEKSTAGGVSALLENAKTGVKKMVATTYDKTYVGKVFPNLLPSLTLGEVDGFDANYYGNTLAEQGFENAMARISGLDDDMSGMEGEYLLPEIGRTPDTTYQAMEAAGDLGSFADTAAQVSANW